MTSDAWARPIIACDEKRQVHDGCHLHTIGSDPVH